MPVGVETNPAWVNNPPELGPTVGRLEISHALDPNITQATLNALVAASTTVIPSGLTVVPPAGMGALLQVQSWNGATSGATNSPKYPTLAIATTTRNGLGYGVITGNLPGPGSAVQSAITLGTASVVNVTLMGGPVFVLIDGTAAVGNVLLQSTSNAGCFTPTAVASAVAGETYGVAATAVTVGSGIGGCFAYLYHA